MNKWIINTFGLKGSWKWACEQMKKGLVVKPKNITGYVKYRFSRDSQNRLEWAFVMTLDEKTVWENAFWFYQNMTDSIWEIYVEKEAKGGN